MKYYYFNIQLLAVIDRCNTIYTIHKRRNDSVAHNQLHLRLTTALIITSQNKLKQCVSKCLITLINQLRRRNPHLALNGNSLILLHTTV